MLNAAHSLRLVFMGTPDFAVPALRALAAAGHDIVAVYAQPPRKAGRGQQLRPSPVQAAAEAAGIPVFTPATLKAPEDQARFAALGAEAAVVAAYGLILPRPVLDAMPLGCWNIHASLLPRWRGAAPIQRAILAGDTQTGVCIMRMEAGLDTGPVLLRAAVPILPESTGGSLHDALAALGAQLIVEAMPAIATGAQALVPQPGDGVTYAAKIDKAETRLDFRRPAADLVRQVRAFAPAPGAWFALPPGPGEAEGERVRVLAAEAVPAVAAASPGMLVSPIVIACGEEALRVLALQRAGRAPVEGGAMLSGWRIPAGTQLPVAANGGENGHGG